MRTTVSLNDDVYRALKARAAESDQSLSSYIEDAIKYQILEDLEDLEDVKERGAEPMLSFDELVEQFQAEGLLDGPKPSSE